MMATQVRLVAFLFLLTLASGFARADELSETTGVEPVVYQILESPYDEEKLSKLTPFGLDKVSLQKDHDGALIAEKYSSSDNKMTAVVTRRADSGLVRNIVVSLVVPRGAAKKTWDISGQSFTSCNPGTNGGCKVTKIDECKVKDAAYNSKLTKICSFLNEAVVTAKSDSSGAGGKCSCPPGMSCSCPSPEPSSTHHIRRIKLKF